VGLALNSPVLKEVALVHHLKGRALKEVLMVIRKLPNPPIGPPKCLNKVLKIKVPCVKQRLKVNGPRQKEYLG